MVKIAAIRSVYATKKIHQNGFAAGLRPAESVCPDS